MPTRNEVTNQAKVRRKRAPSWPEFERGLAVTLPALGEAHLVISTKVKVGNRYVQFATDPELGLLAETVSNAYLKPDEQHTEVHVTALRELGWNEPTHAPDAPKDERVEGGSANYFRSWEPAVPWDEVARVAVKTLQVTGVASPDLLEYHAWDSEGRPLSLPALRLAARKEPAGRKAAKATLPSKGTSKARKASAAAREARAQLLTAVRVYSADNALEYGENGEIPMRFGASQGWARFHEEPLLVKLYWLLARGVEVNEALLRRLHEINHDWFLVRLILVRDNVYATVDFPAKPFCIEHFTSCCSALLAIEHELGEEMRSKVPAEAEAKG